MTRTPLSRSKGQGHQAALLTAVFTHQAAAAVSMGKYSPWETTATLPSAGAAARGAWAPADGREGRGHILTAAGLQFVQYQTMRARMCGNADFYRDENILWTAVRHRRRRHRAGGGTCPPNF